MSSVNMISTEICKRTRQDTLTKSGIEWLTRLASITRVTDLDTQIKHWAQVATTIIIITEILVTPMRQEGDIICHTKLVDKMLQSL